MISRFVMRIRRTKDEMFRFVLCISWNVVWVILLVKNPELPDLSSTDCFRKMHPIDPCPDSERCSLEHLPPHLVQLP